MDKLKLQWKIFAFLLGFCGLLLVILWLFITVFLSDMYKFVRKIETNQAIKLVEENINNPDLQSIFYELDTSKEIFVTPTDDFRQPIKDRGKMKMETITEVRAFTLQNGEEISLTFHAIITPVDATVSTLQLQLYIITIIMIILSICLAFIIAKHVSKPIVKINNSAKLLASGQYDSNFSGHGFLEITELSKTLNQAAIDLSKTENLRRELLANISHDLRTPLALIYSYAEMMHDFPLEITPEQTQVIMDETTRLTTLVNDVLDVSKLESGATELNFSTYSLTKSINNTVERIFELVKKEGYILNFEYNDDVNVIADEVKITQAFYNLLLNAITHGGTDKIVTVRQSIEADEVKIEVIDTGEGVLPENLPYIWDRYYKVDKKHKRAITGTGLGLSIVKKIIDMHRGSIGVVSLPEKGSSFWFKIKINK